MKKTLCLICGILLALLLFACSPQPEPSEGFAMPDGSHTYELSPEPASASGPADLSVAAVFAASDNRIHIGFLGAEAVSYSDVVNAAAAALSRQNIHVEVDSSYVTGEILLNRLRLHSNDTTMLNAFVASFTDLAQLSNLDGLQLGILLSEPSSDGRGDYTALFLRQNLVSNDMLAFNLIANGFQPIVSVDNVSKLLRDSTSLHTTLRPLLEQSTAAHFPVPEITDEIIRLAGTRVRHTWDAELPDVLSFSLNAERDRLIGEVSGDSEIAFETYTSDVGVIGVNISVTAKVTDGGELSFRWYRLLENGVLQYIDAATDSDGNVSTSTLRIETAQAGFYQFYVDIINTNSDSRQPMAFAPRRQATVNIIERVLPPYQGFEVFFSEYNYHFETNLQIAQYGGNQLERLYSFVREQILSDPNNVRVIQVDGLFYEYRDGFRARGIQLAQDRADAVANALRDMGVEVEIHPTVNTAQGDDDWRQRRVDIIVGFHD